METKDELPTLVMAFLFTLLGGFEFGNQRWYGILIALTYLGESYGALILFTCEIGEILQYA